MKHTLIRTARSAAAAGSVFRLRATAPAGGAARRCASFMWDGVLIAEAAIAKRKIMQPAPPRRRRGRRPSLVIRHLLLRRAEALKLEPDTERDEYGREETPEEAVRQVLQREAQGMSQPSRMPPSTRCRRRSSPRPKSEASHILFEPGAPGDEV